MADHAARRERLRPAIAAADAHGLLVTDLVNLRYLTGFTGSAGIALIGAEAGHDRFATDGRYTTQAEQEVPDLLRTITRERTWLRDAVPAGARLAVEGTHLSLSQARQLADLLDGRDVHALDDAVEEVRQIKDDDELALLRRAADIAGRAFLDSLDQIQPGRTERDVALHLERAMVDLGADERAFPSIVASGPNGARPHHRAGPRQLERGDVVTLDFGALVVGYHSDQTRVVLLGDPGDRMGAVVDAVLAAQRAGLAATRSGVAAGTVDAACRDHLAGAGLAEHFVHGTGHGVGLGLHEVPFLMAGASATLRDRMVVTVEPGVYLPGLGGARIEDMVVVGPRGPEVLTEIPTDPFAL
jgi:Xaa-Pro aminopeptidase